MPSLPPVVNRSAFLMEDKRGVDTAGGVPAFDHGPQWV